VHYAVLLGVQRSQRAHRTQSKHLLTGINSYLDVNAAATTISTSAQSHHYRKD
jgi:hypothetical protein